MARSAHPQRMLPYPHALLLPPAKQCAGTHENIYQEDSCAGAARVGVQTLRDWLVGCLQSEPAILVAQVTPEVLYCAKKAGVTHVLKAGGAQAVAAMAWGTQSCPKVEPSAFPNFYQEQPTAHSCVFNVPIWLISVPPFGKQASAVHPEVCTGVQQETTEAFHA